MIDLEIDPTREPASAAAATPARPARSTPAPVYVVGTVIAQAERRFIVESAGGSLEARRAASCLLEPAIGDLVACLQAAPDEIWVVAVLEREEGVANTLRCEGPT